MMGTNHTHSKTSSNSRLAPECRGVFSSFGAIKAAQAFEREALIEADRKLNEVKAEVVRFSQDIKMYRESISELHKQLAAAEQAHRLVQANCGTGTMTILDLLQSQRSPRLQREVALVAGLSP